MWTKILAENLIFKEDFGVNLGAQAEASTRKYNKDRGDSSNWSIGWTVAKVSSDMASCKNYTDVCYILETPELNLFIAGQQQNLRTIDFSHYSVII